MDPAHTARRLWFHGILLFWLGLVTGIAVPVFSNPRMGVSAHLEGVLNGIFLVALGLIWGHLRLTSRPRRVALGLVLYGTYTNWLMTTLAAVWGTSRLTPIAGAGHSAADWQELVMGAGLVSLSLAMVTGLGLVLYGLRGTPADAA